jgi:hypothetical protein
VVSMFDAIRRDRRVNLAHAVKLNNRSCKCMPAREASRVLLDSFVSKSIQNKGNKLVSSLAYMDEQDA